LSPTPTTAGLPVGDELKYVTNAGHFVLYSREQKSKYILEKGGHGPNTTTHYISRPGKNSGIVTVTWAGQLIGHHIIPHPDVKNLI
jgi:hypothetical protein